MKYTRITTKTQYREYCKKYEKIITLCVSRGLDETKNEEAELLFVLIKDYDERHSYKTVKSNPVEFIRHLMEDNKISAARLAMEIGVSKGTISDILNYKKGMGKTFIRKTAEYFKIDQAKLNVKYNLEDYKIAS
ncbi:MAG: type II toxin-antitoxin system HigA family antitoxin [Flavobacteriales bacterium]